MKFVYKFLKAGAKECRKTDFKCQFSETQTQTQKQLTRVTF